MEHIHVRRVAGNVQSLLQIHIPLQEKKGHVFESETDTEVIAKLIFHLYSIHKDLNFRELVEAAIQQLVTSFLSLQSR